MRIQTIAAAPGLFVSAANGAKTIPLQRRVVLPEIAIRRKPWRTQSVARKNSISSQFSGCRPRIASTRTAAATIVTPISSADDGSLAHDSGPFRNCSTISRIVRRTA